MNNIYTSAIGGFIMIVVSILVLSLWKPNIVKKKNNKIQWNRIISLSIVLGIVVSIVICLLTMKTLPKQHTSNDNTTNKVAVCY